MNAPVASIEHSSRSVCGKTAAAAQLSAASPFSLTAAGVSSLHALSAAAPQYRSYAPAVSGISSDTTSAATGRSRYNTTSVLTPSAASNATETAAVQQQHHELEWQQEQQHVEEQQLLRKVEALTEILESTSTSTVVRNSSQRVSCSTTRRAEYPREKYSFSSINSSVGGETPSAARRRKGIARECEGGSDCSTRSCASGRVLQIKEATNSSGDETNISSRPPHVSPTITLEEETKIHCGSTSVSQQKQHCMYEGHCSSNAGSNGSFVFKVSEAERNDRKHLQQTSRSGRRATRDHSTRQRHRVVQDKLQQQQQKSHRSSSCGALAEKRKTLEAVVLTSRHSHRGQATDSGNHFHVSRGENFTVQEDVNFPQDESISAPAFVTPRGGTRTLVVADASAPAATAAFRATTTVSAAVVAVDQPGLPAEYCSFAEGQRCATAAKTEVVGETYHVANSSKRATPEGEFDAGVGVGSQTSTTSSTPLFLSGRSIESTKKGESLRFAKLPFAPYYHSGKHQETLQWSTLGLPSAHFVVSLPSATAASYSVTPGTSAAAIEKSRGNFERTRGGEGGWHEEEEEGDHEEAADFAAPKGEEIREDNFVTAAGEGRVLVASANNSRAGNLPFAAVSEGLNGGAATATADNTGRHCVIDSCGVGVPFASVRSSVERGRAATLCEGKGGAASRKGKGEAAPVEGKGGGVRLVVTCSGMRGGGRGIVEAGTAAEGRKIQGGGAAAFSGGDRDLQLTDVSCQRPGGGGGTGGAGGGNTLWSSSSRGGCVSEMAAGGERGCPGGMLLCAAPGGGAKGGGGDVKTAGCVGTMRGNDFRYNNRNAGTVNMGRAATVMNRPTRVEAGRQRFLILDSPSDENLPAYIEEMKAFNVTHLVRTCEATYDDALVRQAGICTHEWIFPDGEPPPEEVIDEWLALCNSVAAQPRPAAIAVHCVAGLGRAPVLVAVALIEKGMDPMDAIMFIRERRKGAINRRQLQFLKSYRRRSQMQRCCIKGCSIM